MHGFRCPPFPAPECASAGWSLTLRACAAACASKSEEWRCAQNRSAAKEAAAGEACQWITFQDIDDIIFNVLKVPHYHLELIGVQRVCPCLYCTSNAKIPACV